MIVILLIVLSLVSIAAITIVVAQNTACPFKRTCDELLSQNQLNLCQQNNMPSQNEEK